MVMTSDDPYGTNFPTTANPTAQGYPAGGHVPPPPGDPGYVAVIPPTSPAETYHAPTQDEQPSTPPPMWPKVRPARWPAGPPMLRSRSLGWRRNR